MADKPEVKRKKRVKTPKKKREWSFNSLEKVGDWLVQDFEDQDEIRRYRIASKYWGKRVSVRKTVEGEKSYLVELEELLSDK